MQRYEPGLWALQLSSLITLAMVGLLIRLAHMQLLQRENFTQRAMAQRNYTVPILFIVWESWTRIG